MFSWKVADAADGVLGLVNSFSTEYFWGVDVINFGYLFMDCLFVDCVRATRTTDSVIKFLFLVLLCTAILNIK